MPIPSSINDLSTTAGSNSPAGSESPSLIDDYLRTYASYIALLRDAAQNNSFNMATAGGTANAITATYSPAVTTLVDGMLLLVKASATNTGATTFSPNGMTAKPVVGLAYTALRGGEIIANGEVWLQYNSSVGSGSWVLVVSTGGMVDPWPGFPIGVPVPLFTHYGLADPPTDGTYRYIKLTAADAYNTGVLTGEVVSGTAPLVQATAVVSLAGSPLNGLTVSLINTDRRVLRAGQPGVREFDQLQGHRHGSLIANFVTNAGLVAASGSAVAAGLNTSNSTGDPVTDTTNGVPRVGDETRAKSIGVTYYMRIK